MSDKKNLEILGTGLSNGLKIVAAIVLGKPIFHALGEMVETLSLLVQINLKSAAKISQKTIDRVRQHPRGILYTLLVIIVSAGIFFTLGAGFESHTLMALGGLTLIIPMSVLAFAGQTVAKLIALHIQANKEVLSGFHTLLLQIIAKAGIEIENELPKPELINEVKFMDKANKVWVALIPIGLVSTFCIFFPAWKSLGMIPVVIFLIIILSIMADQWADIDLAADDKKLIRTAKSKRKIYKLVSLGLTLLLIWTVFSVVFNDTAEAMKQSTTKTDNEAAEYVMKKGSFFGLGKGLALDAYHGIVDPINKYRAKQARKDALAQARADSLAKYRAKARYEYPLQFKLKVGEEFTILNPGRKTFWIFTDAGEKFIIEGQPDKIVRVYRPTKKLYFRAKTMNELVWPQKMKKKKTIKIV